jgi:hypothetical protein
MRGARVVAAHVRAGSVEPTRLAVRVGETTAAAAIAEALLRPGRFRVGPLELRVDVEAGGEVASVRATVRNASDRDVALESVVLGFRWTGHAAHSFRFLRHGWQSWSFTGARDLDERGEPEFPSGSWLRGMHHVVGSVPPDRRGWHESDLATVVGATPTGPACLVGVLERGRSFGVVYARRDGEALRLEAELCVGAILPAGATRELEPVRVALGDDASALLEAYAEAHGRAADARTARPLLAGWCTWYHFFHDVTEDDVRRNLDALAAAREAIPVDVVQIDDGYQAAVGDWLDTNAKFPSGLAALASPPTSAPRASFRVSGRRPSASSPRAGCSAVTATGCSGAAATGFAACCTRAGPRTARCSSWTRAARRSSGTCATCFTHWWRWALPTSSSTSSTPPR